MVVFEREPPVTGTTVRVTSYVPGVVKTCDTEGPVVRSCSELSPKSHTYSSTCVVFGTVAPVNVTEAPADGVLFVELIDTPNSATLTGAVTGGSVESSAIVTVPVMV